MGPVVGVVRFLLSYIVGLFWAVAVFLQICRLLITKPRKFLYSRNRKCPPPCLRDLDLGMHGYARVNGIRLHYVASGSAGKPLMLLLHGFPEFWYSWRHQIRAFKDTHRVVAVDLRGYGESDRPPQVDDYTLEKMVDDIRELIPALGYDKCILIGHDWGGAITWGVTSKYPHCVSQAAILNCPHPVAMHRFVQSSWDQFMKSWYMFFFNLPWLPELFFYSGDRKMLDNAFRGKLMGARPGAFTDEDMEAFKFNFNKRSDFTGPMNYIRASFRCGLMKCLRAPIQDTPVCLIWGTRDGALDLKMAEMSRDFAKNMKLNLVEGASHWVQQDEPEKVNNHISAFLNQELLVESLYD